MHQVFGIIVWIVLANITYGNHLSKSSTISYHSGYSTVGNPNIQPEYDCALRAFTI